MRPRGIDAPATAYAVPVAVASRSSKINDFHVS